MENNLLSIASEYNYWKDELLHGGYNGKFLNEQIIQVIIEQLMKLENLDLQLALRNMYYLGEIIEQNKK